MKKVILILSLSLFANCAFKELRAPKDLGNFSVIAKSNTPSTEAVTTTVTGKHCRYTNFYSGNHPQLNLAVQDAVSKTPGSKGLKNVTVSYYFAAGYQNLAVLIPILGILGFPLHESCYIVEGSPVQ